MAAAAVSLPYGWSSNEFLNPLPSSTYQQIGRRQRVYEDGHFAPQVKRVRRMSPPRPSPTLKQHKRTRKISPLDERHLRLKTPHHHALFTKHADFCADQGPTVPLEATTDTSGYWSVNKRQRFEPAVCSRKTEESQHSMEVVPFVPQTGQQSWDHPGPPVQFSSHLPVATLRSTGSDLVQLHRQPWVHEHRGPPRSSSAPQLLLTQIPPVEERPNGRQVLYETKQCRIELVAESEDEEEVCVMDVED
eukprot:gb/GEZN01011547.1/.p1 GENE.gb/GEZN01011547.1/~~gb/GEZN01011547.1/.p1  ORF type:complete len:247 (-),score=16.74 gb/GEZN01011547.1/:284-1024(-)